MQRLAHIARLHIVPLGEFVTTMCGRRVRAGELEEMPAARVCESCVALANKVRMAPARRVLV